MTKYNGSKPISVRDSLWKHLVDDYYSVRQRVLDEEIELAYSSLYGYDQAIRELYTKSVYLVETKIDSSFRRVLLGTQAAILNFSSPSNNGESSAILGNILRRETRHTRLELTSSLKEVEDVFRKEISEPPREFRRLFYL